MSILAAANFIVGVFVAALIIQAANQHPQATDGGAGHGRPQPSGNPMNQADMVLTLLKALQDHREPRPPARLSPFTERAYAEAEAAMRRHVAREAS